MDDLFICLLLIAGCLENKRECHHRVLHGEIMFAKALKNVICSRRFSSRMTLPFRFNL